jgi:ADP-ribose pyrophosphatase YjhB (NUDIX family)
LKYKWKELAQELLSIAQEGLTYSKDRYDIDRFKRLKAISARIMSDFTDTNLEKLTALYAEEKGYSTPKLDIRGAIFQNRKLLLVQEKDTQKWSIPGGWADVGLSPAENVVKEVAEEAGLQVKPLKILAVWDKRFHAHPPDSYHVYKIVFLCEIIGGTLTPGFETRDVRYFAQDEIPPLSTNRITSEQIDFLFESLKSPQQSTSWD